MMIIILVHGQPIKLASWRSSYATVHTIRGSAVANSEDPDEAVKRSIKIPHPLATSLTKETYCLNAYDARNLLYQHHKKAFEQAKVLNTEDIVMVDGGRYRVTLRHGEEGQPYPMTSEPILFTPAAFAD